MKEIPPRAVEGWCMHYTGIMGPGMTDILCCDAGVNYRKLAGGVAPGWVLKLPCTQGAAKSPAGQVSCEKRLMPTPEQIAACDAWEDERTRQTITAMHQCRADHRASGKYVGSIECPVCHGKLSYSVARSNGHLWGTCETADCLSWMQ